MVTIQKYVRAASLEEAYQLNQSRRNRIIGGMLWMKMGKGSVSTAIDLCDLGLDTIEDREDSFSIGAMVTLRQLEQHPGLNAYTRNGVCNALKDIIGVQFRNMATVGGSLWGRFGFSDVLTVFLALDSWVELYKGGLVPLEKFAGQKHDQDILVRLVVKKRPGKLVYTAMRNQSTDFPTIACALSQVNGEYRAVIGARPGRAMVVRDTRGLLNGGITRESADAFAAFLEETVPTGTNLRAGADYRSHLIRVLCSRALLELGGM